MSGRALWLLLAMATASACTAELDRERRRAFEDAGQRFLRAESADEYLESAALYESILRGGYRSGAVLYNLGNAYAKAGQRGRAIGAWRQALRYRPRDPYLQSNLETLLPPDAEAPFAVPALVHQVLFFQRWLSYPEKATLVLLGAALTFAAGALGLLRPARRAAARRAVWVLSAALVLGVASFALDVYEYDLHTHGVVTAPEILARKGDAESYEPAFTEPLAEGAEFTVIEQRGRWVHVRLGRELEGWIPSSAALLY